MPIYTYRCINCEHEFEARQRMTDDPLTGCPQCEGTIRRVVNSVGVVFKGKGFYVTDNRGNKAQAASSPSTTKTDEGNSGKSDASNNSDKSSSPNSSDSKSTKSEKSKSAA